MSFFRSCSAMLPAKFFLKLYGSHGGVDLNLAMELLVIGFAQVFHKVAGPGAAIAAIGIKPGIKAQRLPRNNGNQLLADLQLFELVIVLDARQVQQVNFIILTKQGVGVRMDDWIPA